MVFNILENACKIISNMLCLALCYTSNDNTPLLKSDCITSRIGIYEKVSLTRLFIRRFPVPTERITLPSVIC